jgi:hypothetical protein
MQRSLRRVCGPCRAELPAKTMSTIGKPSEWLASFGGGLKASLQEAFKCASARVSLLSPEEAVARTGAGTYPGGVSICFLGRTYGVDFRQGAVLDLSGQEATVDLTVSTLLLHYLLHSDGSPLTGIRASYREFPGAQIYYGPFVGRTVSPLARTFGTRPQDLVLAGGELGGRPVELGDGAVVLDVLPRLPMTFAVWAGDDEVPASGSVLFDSSAASYLPLEDLVIAASLAVMALRRAAPPESSQIGKGGGD